MQPPVLFGDAELDSRTRDGRFPEQLRFRRHPPGKGSLEEGLLTGCRLCKRRRQSVLCSDNTDEIRTSTQGPSCAEERVLFTSSSRGLGGVHQANNPLGESGRQIQAGRLSCAHHGRSTAGRDLQITIRRGGLGEWGAFYQH